MTDVSPENLEEPNAGVRRGLLLCLRAGAVCTAIAVLGGGAVVAARPEPSPIAAGLGFALGAGIAGVSFLLSSLIIAWVDTIDRRMILPVGLMTYVFKILVIGMVVFGLSRGDWPGFVPLLWGIAAGATGWIFTQAISTYRWGLTQPAIHENGQTESNAASGTVMEDSES